MPGADFYSVLGVDRTATQEEIRRAYRRLVRELHPDASEGASADGERLHEVLEAYSVLGHPQRRAAYDQALRRAELTYPLWTGLAHSRLQAWPERSMFDELRSTFNEPDIFRILFRWFR